MHKLAAIDQSTLFLEGFLRRECSAFFLNSGKPGVPRDSIGEPCVLFAWKNIQLHMCMRVRLGLASVLSCHACVCTIECMHAMHACVYQNACMRTHAMHACVYIVLSCHDVYTRMPCMHVLKNACMPCMHICVCVYAWGLPLAFRMHACHHIYYVHAC